MKNRNNCNYYAPPSPIFEKEDEGQVRRQFLQMFPTMYNRTEHDTEKQCEQDKHSTECNMEWT